MISLFSTEFNLNILKPLMIMSECIDSDSLSNVHVYITTWKYNISTLMVAGREPPPLCDHVSRYVLWCLASRREINGRKAASVVSGPCMVRIRAVNDLSVFIITERAPTRAFSWLKVSTSAFTLKSLLRHYAKWVLTHSKYRWGRQHKGHKGRD